MAKAEPGHVCDMCKKPVREDEEWIALDGGQVWCAACWAKRFYDRPASFPAPEAAPPTAGARPAPWAPAGGRPQPATEVEEVPVELILEPPVERGRRRGGYTQAPPQAGPAGAAQSSWGDLPCGARGESTHPPAMPGAGAIAIEPKTSGLAIASLVVALVGIIPCVGIPLGATAILLGALGLRSLRKKPGLKGRGLALAGLITGIVEVVGHLVILLLVLLGPLAFLTAALSELK